MVFGAKLIDGDPCPDCSRPMIVVHRSPRRGQPVYQEEQVLRCPACHREQQRIFPIPENFRVAS